MMRKNATHTDKQNAKEYSEIELTPTGRRHPQVREKGGDNKAGKSRTKMKRRRKRKRKGK
jgi:hypothetical protein